MNNIRSNRLCAAFYRTHHCPYLLQSVSVNSARRRPTVYVICNVARATRNDFSTSLRSSDTVQPEPSAPLQDVTSFWPSTAPTIVTTSRNATVPKPGLPQSCPGCGALTQKSQPDEAGYYSTSRRAIKDYLRKQKAAIRTSSDHEPGEEHEEHNEEEEEAVPEDHKGPETAQIAARSTEQTTLRVPMCDRCHDLLHNSRGRSIAHPSLDALADSIAESPFKRNHVYHVLDAADFPMSVVPDIFSKLTLARPRSQNRRSQHDFSSKPTVSFIITRSDLLGSTKEMVDSMMTYFQTVLRTALGRAGRDMRLGNVHLVSAKRGWWTKEVKEEIWKRGGGNWMLGKVNVGKSNLFEVLFPKGSGERAPVYAELRAKHEKQDSLRTERDSEEEEELDLLEENHLLPPAQPETPFPVLPLVSSLPGTTASPIRLPFGGHKGELIDLPGLARGDLEIHVKPENRTDLVMTSRQTVEQHIVKAGQSLVLGGGLIRISPQLDVNDRSMTMLAYAFVPLKTHTTSTTKAAAQQVEQRENGLKSVVAEGAGAHMASAGTLELSTDVTKYRAASLLRAGVQLSNLPFRVYATDILIEGLGWVELVCQVRRRGVSQPASEAVAPAAQKIEDAPSRDPQHSPRDDDFAPFGQRPFSANQEKTFQFPKVEVFSPNGKHIAQRPSLQAWMRWTEGRKQKDTQKTKRPRRAMKGRQA
ncbi:hypothetical protein LTR64_000604 [Lithohypha guttulata]|uniref:uncharacterized protein n=1 Tax=Lithohypha guttulata TaxID=1690604 RepID=UPI002DE1A2EB|nr:hypothetical protein LTR51_005630 [Lithohypha guttulata]